MTRHAVVAVPNDLLVETRAQKVALSLRDLGYRVTLVGTTSGPQLEREVGDVPARLVSVPRVLGAPAPARRGLTVPEGRRRDRLRLERLRMMAESGRMAPERASPATTSDVLARVGGLLAQVQAAARAWADRERRDGNDYDELAGRVELLAREPGHRSPHADQAQGTAASPSAEEPDGR